MWQITGRLQMQWTGLLGSTMAIEMGCDGDPYTPVHHPHCPCRIPRLLPRSPSSGLLAR